MEKLTVKLTCGSEIGTAFYITDNLLLTAYHAVCTSTDGDKISLLGTNDSTCEAIVEKIWEECDVALLKVNASVGFSNFSLYAHAQRVGEKYTTFGYADKAITNGVKMQGKIRQRTFDSPADFILSCDQTKYSDLSGMSGSPVWCHQGVIGVVTNQSEVGLHFVSIKKIAKYLESFDIKIKEDELVQNLPLVLSKAVETSHPNYFMYDALDELIKQDGNWFLMYGAPGCGKTVLSASYNATEETCILGRYFFKVPEDNISVAERCSVRYFVDWFEKLFIQYTGSELEILKPEEKKKRIASWLFEIGESLSSEGKNGLIIIDGLDELVTNGLNVISDFLNIIASALPDNVKILLSCTSRDILPDAVVNLLISERTIEVKPLDMAACEVFIASHCKVLKCDYSFIQTVALKTEGHPLYMNYLCRYITDHFSENTKDYELETWIEELPSIGGNIETYYDVIWRKVSADGVSLEILSILSQVRGGVAESELTEMLQSTNRIAFYSKIDNLRYLLKSQNGEYYEIYHSSFGLYLTRKMSANINIINDQIASFCNSHNDLLYAIENTLHHSVFGSDVMKGLKMCDQRWADECMLSDVSPDLVIHDIKECLEKAVDNCKPLEVFRIMLLAQRIECRYDTMLAENANEIANLKLAQHNPKAVLKYLIRDDTLIISEIDAISYLQQLYDFGYEKQAHLLFEAIDAKCRNRLHVKEESGTISIMPLIAKGEAEVELLNEGEDSENRLFQTYKFFNRYKQINAEEGFEENVKAMNMVHSSVCSYQVAHHIRKGRVPNLDQFFTNIPKGNIAELFTMIFRALYFYTEMDKPLVYQGKNEGFYNTLADLEKKLQVYKPKFEKQDLYWVTNVLITNSKNCGLVKDVIAQSNPKDVPLVLRKSNGVDVNYSSLVSVYEQMWYIGYSDDNNNYPKISDLKGTTCPLWEEYFSSLIKHIAYLQGYLARKAADANDLSSEYKYLAGVLNKIDFTFKKRVEWERSYQIPELLFPYLYAKISTLYRDYFPHHVQDLMNHISTRSNNQMSLFREGYRDVLFEIIDRFVETHSFCEETKILLSQLFAFIKNAEQNRQERTSSLLRLASLYATIGLNEDCNEVYQEALNASLGPSWYKEAQTGLLNHFTDYNIKLDAKQCAQIAAIFEEASGEMTFKRYVQQGQNSFIQTLVRTSSLSDAIKYYKFKTLPPSDIVKLNAESWQVDMPEMGEGYNLGANYLIEASALHYLLDNVREASPYIVYALSELHWDNDDNFRYMSSYADLHIKLLKKLEKSRVIDDLIPRIAFYITENLVGRHEKDYLNAIAVADLDLDIKKALQEQLKLAGYTWKVDFCQVPQEIEEKELMKKSSAMKLKEILINKKRNIVNPLSDYWYAMDGIMDSIVNNMDPFPVELYDILKEHFDNTVRPTEDNIRLCSWMKGAHKEECVDVQLMHFLCWFLVHPNKTIVERAYEVIKWLKIYESGILNILAEETINISEYGLPTLCTELLRDVAKDDAHIILPMLDDQSLVEKLAGVTNFSVSNNLYNMAFELDRQCHYSNLLKKIEITFPDNLPEKGDIMLDYEKMMFIEHEIDKLDNLHVLGADFAKKYLTEVNSLIKSSQIFNMIKTDIYIRRSFFLQYVYNGRYLRMMNDIIDRILYSTIDKGKRDLVYDAINQQ